MANKDDLRWRKSSYSGQMGECVEIASVHGAVAVRDSKKLDGPMLTFTAGAFASLLALARSTEVPHIRG